MDTYLININIKLYFWIFIFPFCFDLVKFFSVTLTSDVLQRIVRLFLGRSGSLRLASSGSSHLQPLSEGVQRVLIRGAKGKLCFHSAPFKTNMDR